jgi:hypothetical protein
MLIRERYKVVRVLDARENYAFLEAVDIQDREKSNCVLNLYEGPLLRDFLSCFDRLSDCPEYRGMFVTGETLVAVFDRYEGRTIDEVFYRGADHDWKTRLTYAELLLHQALSLANLPPEVSCAALLSNNILVDLPGERIRLRWHVAPLGGMNGRELAWLAGDQVKKILLPRFSSPMEELEFLEQADSGACLSVVRLYALWRKEREKIRSAYEALDQKNPFKRWLTLLVKAIQWKIRMRKRGG